MVVRDSQILTLARTGPGLEETKVTQSLRPPPLGSGIRWPDGWRRQFRRRSPKARPCVGPPAGGRQVLAVAITPGTVQARLGSALPVCIGQESNAPLHLFHGTRIGTGCRGARLANPPGSNQLRRKAHLGIQNRDRERGGDDPLGELAQSKVDL